MKKLTIGILGFLGILVGACVTVWATIHDNNQTIYKYIPSEEPHFNENNYIQNVSETEDNTQPQVIYNNRPSAIVNVQTPEKAVHVELEGAGQIRVNDEEVTVNTITSNEPANNDESSEIEIFN